ncbi:ASCH domain-containing protein [Anaeroselena agilis]|uniref:ASCH domain-containing protein n=1 Tax=Anaeroselena agilis TaxID=3063788 RepID=A0ABU3P076_9FIRM|nr:ASCH domain-containing protein [Selenomonadales bacterium 4137-cl]
MLALNFQSELHEKLLVERKKNYTVRLGDISNIYLENSVVWITVGKKYAPKRKLYSAFLDRVKVKRFAELTKDDLAHQNPDLKSVEELIALFEQIYQKNLTEDDLVTVIGFSEVTGD